jgi:C4-dicarboxylate transporter
MNDQLQAQLTQIIAQIATSVGEVKDFSVQQLPDIAQQYIQYGIWSTSFNIVVAILFFIVCFIGVIKGVKKHKKIMSEYKYDDDDDDDLYSILLMVFCSGFGFVSLLYLIDRIQSLILLLTTPKVWFILEIKNILS